MDEFGWRVELDQRYVTSLLDAMAMNHCKSVATLDRRDGRATMRRRNWVQRNIESSDEQRFDIAFCKDNTSKDSFSQCEQLQGIYIQVKSEYVGTLTTLELRTRRQSDKHNNMFKVAANVKHVNTHKNNN